MGINDKIETKRHEELLESNASVVAAIKLLPKEFPKPKEDAELKKLLLENKQAIDNFVKAVESIKNIQVSPEVNVQVSNDKLAEVFSEAMGNLVVVMDGIDKRLLQLEKPKDPVVYDHQIFYGESNRIKQIISTPKK